MKFVHLMETVNLKYHQKTGTSTAECIQSDGKNFEYELENNGQFCYYSECKKDGECQTGYTCNVQIDTIDDVLYAYGIFEGDGNESGVIDYNTLGSLIIFIN